MLATLPDEDRARLKPHLLRVRLPASRVLVDAGNPVAHVHFPCGGVVALLAGMANGRSVEVGLIGDEGVVGLQVDLVPGLPALFAAVVQVPGDALRLPIAVLREEVHRSAVLADVLHRYALTQLVEARRAAACNAVHSAASRLARGLLSIHDRVGEPEFRLTQESMARMMAVRQATVSGAQVALQESGAIRCTRGRIAVLDRDRLEAAACECYFAIEGALGYFLESAPPRHSS